MIQFEWDEAKERSNRVKHGITFEDAMAVFDDPDAVFQKDRVVDGELRWHAIGIASEMTILLVAHVIREAFDEADELIRLISARLATRKEQILYDENRTKDLG